MRILGIDPGSQTTGFGIIEQVRGKQIYVTSGCIRTGKHPWEQRLQHIFEGLTKVIQDFSPTVAAIEKIFVHINVSSALKLGQARGVAIVAATLNGLSIAEYTARQVKKTVVGNGAADKTQVQHMMKVLLKLSGLPQADAADALAVAICHAQNTRGIL
ncbi:MAG TPA: crossover junction endodeoxyribonuclease RuvC [Gammaproteobacteria bacterium]|nr:crossover junction endodeoxyribonuclease RuvC [Gammaproteobacteria bacterium]